METEVKPPCLPPGTLIDTPKGPKSIETLKEGDEVKGGRVLEIKKFKRPKGHRFYLHKFRGGEVLMSFAHPHFDQVLSREWIYHEATETYDILTTEGFYFVNGVKLGSTLL